MRRRREDEEPWGPILCVCGGLLADAMDSRTVIFNGVRLPFRRRTDYLTCPDCSYSYSVVELRRSRAHFTDPAAAPPADGAAVAGP